ncbi:hypothetical protein GEOBRER4_n1412 [Citrifermentans bremense]|uniref:Lipoprotein n=1 Tax=Citrifermentans bremense TaxID=60035 RepID=A0A6S6M5E0_9BACT|nr:hypothetical protein [Citrifermentans bremense]BCG46605.1 hypothetical protein GEOBRER4_n1412 [Citrifermentans bremense]
MIKQLVLVIVSLAIIACSQEKPSEAPKKLPAVTLTPAERESLLSFQKNLLDKEYIADKAVKIAVTEIKNAISGGQATADLPAIIGRAKGECLKTGAELTQSVIPAKLPPELQASLRDGRDALIASYKAYGEAFDALRSFTAEKNPMLLLEYRKKYAEAQELYGGAAQKIKGALSSCGIATAN